MSRSRPVAVQQTLPFPKELPRPTRQPLPRQKTTLPCPKGYRWVEPGEDLEQFDTLNRFFKCPIGHQLIGQRLRERDRGAFLRPLVKPPGFSFWGALAKMKGKK